MKSTSPHGPEQPAPAASPLLQLLRHRHSCRRYAPTPVPRDQIAACVEAARLAPSACNAQPWRFVVADDPELCARIRTEAKLPGISHTWWDTVPVFVALCAERRLLTHRIAPAFSGIPYHLLDLGIAGEHFVLAATELGLGTCWIGWFRERAVQRILDLPRRRRVLALITVGVPDIDSGPAPDTPPKRLALNHILRWNRDK